MNHRLASILGYVGSVAIATLGAALMGGHAARAEGPIEVLPPFVGTLSRAEVRADLMAGGAQATSYASEWGRQQSAPLDPTLGATREQVRADYIAAREQVHAMTAEDGGSSYFASAPVRTEVTLAASGRR
jgi:hypothetical protein